jgi:hypothetical protein
MTRAGTSTYAYAPDGNQTSKQRRADIRPQRQEPGHQLHHLGGGPLSQSFLGEGQAERTMEGATRLQYSQLLGLGTRADARGASSKIGTAEFVRIVASQVTGRCIG